MSEEQGTGPGERALCELHGLHYNPKLRRGCVVCRRGQAPREAQAPSRTGVLLGSLLMLAIGLGLATVFGFLPLASSAGVSRPVPEASPQAPPPQAAAHPPPPSAAVPAEADPGARDLLVEIPAAELPVGGLSFHALRGELAALQADLQAGASVDEQDERGRTALIWAVLGQKREAVVRLIEAKADVELASYAGLTPLMLAAQSGQASVCTRLIEQGAAVNTVDRHVQTALMLSARSGQASTVRVLLAHGAKLERRCERGMSALAHAAEGSDSNMPVFLLLASGADIDATDSQGATPLLIAAGAGRLANAHELLEHGARITARDSRNQSALDYVVKPRSPLSETLQDKLRGTLHLLLKRGVDRRLGQDPARVDVLFRVELDAAARMEGRPPLPALVREPAGSAARVRPELFEQTFASLRLWQARPMQNSRNLPAQLRSDALLGYRGWTRVPNIIVSVEIHSLSMLGSQRVTLSSDRDGHEAWTIDDILLIEIMRGGSRVRCAFAGTVDQVTLDGQNVPRLGQQGMSFGPGDVDIGPLVSGGADRIVLSLLDYGGVASSTALHLSIQGRDAANTINHARVITR